MESPVLSALEGACLPWSPADHPVSTLTIARVQGTTQTCDLKPKCLEQGRPGVHQVKALARANLMN